MITLFVLVTCFIGWVFLFLICGRKGFSHVSKLEKIGLSYILGLGIITLQMFIMSLFSIGYTRLNIIAPWVIVAAGLMFVKYMKGDIIKRDRFRQDTKPDIETRRPLIRPELALVSLITLQILYNFFRALIKPIESYDAVAIYGLKSKIIYLAGGITGDFFRNLSNNFHGPHPDYPFLVPLSETWLYTFLGRFDDLVVKAIFPLFFLSFIFIFYSILKKATKDRFTALLFTFLLTSIKQFSDYSTMGVADLWLGAYFSSSLFYFYLWMNDKSKMHFLNISLCSLIFSLWTKNEGMLLLFVVLAIFSIYMLQNTRILDKKDIFRFFSYVSLSLVALIAWGLFKSYNGLTNENFNLSMITFRNFLGGLNKIPAILYEYQKQFFGFKKWNILWILFAFVLLKGFKNAISNNIKYITLVFLLFIAGYVSMYIFSAVEIRYFVRFTGSRFLLHILPLAIFWMAIVVNKEKLVKDL